jgi:UDP-glucose 4-epimerase
MKIFVTGGAGFIGSHVTDLLIREGYEVTVYDNLSTGYLDYINPKAKFVLGDLADKEKLTREIRDHDGVIHLASESIIEKSIKNPEETLKRNINFAINLLEAMRANKIDKIVFSSSAAIYGETKGYPVREDDCKEPLQPYGASKLAIESILSGYFHSFKIKSVSLRYFNVYGPRDDQLPVTRAVPKWIKSMLLHQKILLYWKGKQIRDYIYVEDLAKAHILAFKNCNGLENFNVGSGNGVRLIEILDILSEISGIKIEIEDKGDRQGDPQKLFADITKIRRALGWNPETSLKDGLKKTYEFYKTNKKSLERI